MPPGGDTSRVYPPSRSAGPRYCGECGEHAGNSGNHPGRRRERNEGDCRGNRHVLRNAPHAWKPAANWARAPFFEERKQAEVPSRKANLGGLPPVQDSFYLSLALDSIERS